MDTRGDAPAAMTAPEPGPEHRWLQRLIGEWTYEPEPSDPAVEYMPSGTETVRSLGDLWVLAEGGGTVEGGGSHTSLMTIGYDPQKQRFVGSFISSMLPEFWLYEGTLDAAARVLSLDSEGPGMTDPNTRTKYRDQIEFESDDHRIFTSSVLGPDGNWQKFQTIHYRRRR
jgi:hypothetical protein